MLLEPDTIERYARQVIVEELGVHGQRKLLKSHAYVAGAAPGCEAAKLYLRASGISVTADPDERVDCVIAPYPCSGADRPSPPKQDGLLPLVRFDANESDIRVDVDHIARASLKRVAAMQDQRERDPASAALHAAAGCNAAATAIAILLDWPVPRCATGIRLA